jgi:arylsulfatase A-like enzyme
LKKLVETLEALGLRENTPIVFTTDNGATNSLIRTRLNEAVRGAKQEMQIRNLGEAVADAQREVGFWRLQEPGLKDEFTKELDGVQRRWRSKRWAGAF